MAPAGASASAPPEPAVVMAGAAKGMAGELTSSLGAAVNKPLRHGEVEVVTLPAGDLPARMSGPGAAFCLELSGVCKGRAALVLAARTAASLVGLLKGLEGDELAAKAGTEPADEDVEELGMTVAGALPGLAEKLAGSIGEAPGLGLGDALLLPAGDFSELFNLMGGGPYPCAAFELEIEELGKGPALIVFPASFAAMPAFRDEGEGQPAEAAAEPAPEAEAAGEPGDEAVEGLHPNIRRILRLKLPLSVVVAEKPMAVETVISLAPGTIVEFNKSADENLDLRVNDQKIGTGEVVIIGERFGIQLRTIEGLQQRIRKLGRAGK